MRPLIDTPLEIWEGVSAADLASHWRLPAVHLFSAVGSTNDVARRLADAGEPAGTLVLADEQLAGRGRGVRAWSSPPGVGLWCSFLYSGAPSAEVERLPIRVALAIAEALGPWVGNDLRVKWPNDLYLGGRKLGGILCEASWDGHRLGHVVVGVGLNILQAEEEFPDPIRELATSIRAFTGRPVSRFDVTTAAVGALRGLLTEPPPDAADFVDRFAARDYLHGRSVEIRDPESAHLLTEGRACGVGADGALLVESRDGVVRVRSGTVHLV